MSAIEDARWFYLEVENYAIFLFQYVKPNFKLSCVIFHILYIDK